MKTSKKGRHQQSKYFTLMLIPYSSSKTKQVRIPHWTLYLLFSIVFVVASVFFIFDLRNKHLASQIEDLEMIAENKQKDLEDIIEKNWELLQEKNLSTQDLLEQETQFRSLIDFYQDELKTYEEKAIDLETKIDELNEIKLDLYDTLSKKLGDEPNLGISVTSQTSINGKITFASEKPTVDKDVVKLRMTYSELESKLNTEINDFYILQNEVNKHSDYFKALPNRWPIDGDVFITSYFGSRSNPFTGGGSEPHLAIDMRASTGTPVYATGGGTVQFAGIQSGYGYLVIIDHGYGITTYYAHNSSLNVSAGNTVERGDLIAYSGSTGRSTGPHVHYEVRINDVPHDPLDFIE